MRFDVITIFQEMFSALEYSIPGRAATNNIVDINYWNPRDFTKDKHRCVDDRPYGGGPGMVMMAQPLHDCIHKIKEKNSTAKVIHLSPQGRLLDQDGVKYLAAQENLILLCGRYEGIDERVVEQDVDEEWSIGDYVLSGGELAAMVMIDAITRLLPGALGDAESAEQDSFTTGLLDHQHYTRPEAFNGHKVPKMLLSGAHNAIARWRLREALGRTYLRRPKLLKKRGLSKDEQKLLDEFIKEKRELL